jgi:two-component system, OmpR family, KDP operon response regulator KdpE
VTAKTRVLVIDDEPQILRALRINLAVRGYDVFTAASGAEALNKAADHRPDVVVLDLGLPDMSGIDVLGGLRGWLTAPVIVLSARTDSSDKVEALDAGADDYVTKPFGMAELHARVRALLRRAAGPSADDSGVVSLGALRVDMARHTVDVDGTPVRLTPREFEVLKVLVTHAGRLVTHGRLLRAVWGTAYAEEGHYLHVYVSQIRGKLAAADETGVLRRLIVSEPGVGYRIGVPEAVPEART